MLQLELDGQMLEVPEGSTVMDAANKAGVFVPHFCYHKKLSIAANCRMCLVQVEKAPKPLPACATPVTNGMKVWTHSDVAVNAQKGVMEFLLINHPLDCPICDQGGECQLQDLAVGYGGSDSRYEEDKRVVSNKNFGPLIASDMTRCIHCTRCVRFGQEIAGVMELGMMGRGEHSEIVTFVGKTVDSELSGNVIDLCPVGALTSKPFRYSARTWELTQHDSVSPHCGLGSNLTIQIKQNRVMRVLPRLNEAVNECWLSDKDRYAYEALNSASRLPKPMLRQAAGWREVEWSEALDFIVQSLRKIQATYGASAIGGLASPHQTLEELYLFQKLLKASGTKNVDARLRQTDFSRDGYWAGVPWLGMNISDIADLDRVLVVGSTLRKDHPLLAQRLRQNVRKGGELCILHAADDDLLMRVAQKAIVAPEYLPQTLAAIVKAVADLKQCAIPSQVQVFITAVAHTDAVQKIAQSLVSGKNAAVFLGNFAEHHPQSSMLHVLATALAELLGGSMGFLGEAANSAGVHVAACLPEGGLNAQQMMAKPLKAYFLLGVEPELDMHNPRQAVSALQQAELVVAMSPFQHHAVDYAHVMLPIAPFTETAGTFVNTEGRVQSFSGVVQPLGETRPAWKVLRVLGNLLGLDGFEQDSVADIRAELLQGQSEVANRSNALPQFNPVVIAQATVSSGYSRIAEVPIYAADQLVRRAVSLQKTRDAQVPRAHIHSQLAQQLGLNVGDRLRITQDGGETELEFAIDDQLPLSCVRLATACPETAQLGAESAPITLTRIAQQQVMGS